tara:strand:- start:9 stop:182 length:174 start_codon:yes stop_codon:yes gene_type:complete
MDLTAVATLLTTTASITLLYNAWKTQRLVGKLNITGFALLSTGNVLLLHSRLVKQSK